VAVEDFFVGPGQTALKKGELVLSVLIPKPYPTGKGVYKKASAQARWTWPQWGWRYRSGRTKCALL
jgi:CO/xanthine dehydrogenase FAD-binding subunit